MFCINSKNFHSKLSASHGGDFNGSQFGVDISMLSSYFLKIRSKYSQKEVWLRKLLFLSRTLRLTPCFADYGESYPKRKCLLDKAISRYKKFEKRTCILFVRTPSAYLTLPPRIVFKVKLSKVSGFSNVHDWNIFKNAVNGGGSSDLEALNCSRIARAQRHFSTRGLCGFSSGSMCTLFAVICTSWREMMPAYLPKDSIPNGGQFAEK